MEMIRTRNLQQAMPALLGILHEKGIREDEDLVFPTSCTFVLEEPQERLVFWPGFERNPAQELDVALKALSSAQAALPAVAQAVLKGDRRFLFTTPLLVFLAQITKEGRFESTVITNEQGPFLGAFGQLGLQMSFLHELLAIEAKKPVGSLTFQHMGLRAQGAIIATLLRNSLQKPSLVSDPYQSGEVKARKLDGLFGEKPATFLGRGDKWYHKVVVPLRETAALLVTDADAARKKAESIKAADWRAAMLQFITFWTTEGSKRA